MNKVFKPVLLFLIISILNFGSLSVQALECFRLSRSWTQLENATVASPVSTIIRDNGANLIVLQQIHGTDNRLYSRELDPNLYYEGGWSGWRAEGTITVKSEPTLTKIVLNSIEKILVTAFGTDNGLYTRIYSDKNDTPSWQRGGRITLKSSPTVSFVKNIIIQTGFGTDNGVYTRTSLNGIDWTTWTRGGGITIASKVEHLEYDSSLYQFSIGTDNGLYSRSTTDGTSWSGWVRENQGITILHEPSTTTYNHLVSRIFQSVRGTDSRLYYRTSENGVTWTQWISVYGIINYGGGAVRENFEAIINDKPVVFNPENLCTNFVYPSVQFRVRGFDNRLYSNGRFQDENIFNTTNYPYISQTDWSVDPSGLTISQPISEAHRTGYGQYFRIETAVGTNKRIYTSFWKGNYEFDDT